MFKKILKLTKLSKLPKITNLLLPSMPNYATIDEWNDWHRTTRDKLPIRYFIIFDLTSFIRQKITYRISAFYRKIRLKFGKKYNIIYIKSLDSDYHDMDTRLIHGIFSLLIEFVEKEKALMYEFSFSDKKKFKKEKKELTDLQRGIKYLEWETTLDSDPSSNDYSPAQAMAAREILQLIEYWVNRKKSNESLIFNLRGLDHSTYRKIDYIQTDYDNKVDQEEEEMIIRLIKIRKHLWT